MKLNGFYVLCLVLLAGCSSTKHVTEPAETAETTQALQNIQHAEKLAPQIDISALSPTAITPYTQGTPNFTIKDFAPLLADSGGYVQKWEFYIYTLPYEVRLKYEISNFAFSRNEGKIRGYVKRIQDGQEVEKYDISETFKKGNWLAGAEGLDLTFGDYALKYEDGQFYVSGNFERGSFAYEIPANPWKPGSGDVYFGNTENNIFKYSILTYHEPVTKGVVNVDGSEIEVSGQAYANHYATTLNVYDMFNELADFRYRTDDLLIEFRYYVPSHKYDATPFGFMFVAFEGTPILSATTLERNMLEQWLDDAHYGYEIDARQEILGCDDSNQASFKVLTANPIAKDPYANLPAFQRNVASRFAQPIEYSIKADWELDLNVDGYQALIPGRSSYTITRLR